jgi:hypothetical protein
MPENLKPRRRKMGNQGKTLDQELDRGVGQCEECQAENVALKMVQLHELTLYVCHQCHEKYMSLEDA